MAEENPVSQQPQVLAQGARQRLPGYMLGQAFRQAQAYRQQAAGTEQAQRKEDRLPAGQVHQHPTQHRCQDRRQAHDQHQLRKHFG